mgnify:CR=1 FL=1
MLLIAYVLITALDDIGGYFAGTRFGKHKLAPSISPAKSWEGWVGGFLASLAGGLFFAFLLESLDPIHGLAVGAISGPFDSFLALRGLKTLALRMRQSSESALRIAVGGMSKLRGKAQQASCTSGGTRVRSPSTAGCRR